MAGSQITPAEIHSNANLAAEERIERPDTQQLTVHLEADIRADVRRLFYALTAPEYLETWLCFPGYQSACSTLVTKINHDYMIAHQCDGIRNTVITGRYRVSERRHLVLSWRIDGPEDMVETCVDIRLLGNFEYTTLIVRHQGFTSWQQHLWHRSLWSLSLERLSRLYDSSPIEGKSSRPRVRLHTTKITTES